MKRFFSILLPAVGLLTVGCQRISEHYTQKNVFSDCGFGPVSSELTGYLNFCGKTFKDPSLTIATSCLNRAVAVLPKLAPECKAKYESRLQDSVVSIVQAHIEGIKDPPATEGEPITYESAARIIARWNQAGSILYANSYGNSTMTEPGSYQAAYFAIYSKMKTRIVNLMANQGYLAFASEAKEGTDQSLERLSAIARSQAGAMFEEGASELAIETILPFLQSAADRAEVQMKIYEISCKLSKCIPTTEDNARFQMAQLFASYLDKDRLTKAIESATNVPSSLKEPFSVLLKHIEKIEELVGTGSRFKQPVLADFKGTSWAAKRNALRSFINFPQSTSLTRFVRLSAKFADIEEGFLLNKSFDQRSTERLAFNPSSESIRLITTTLSDLNGKLHNEIELLDSKRKETLSNYRDLVKLDSKSLAYDSRRLSLDLADALNDLDVLRQSLTDGRERQAEFLKEATLIASKKSDTFMVEESQIKTIDVSNAKYDGTSEWTSLKDISTTDVSYVAENDNEMLALSVSSQWHPVCALSKSPLAAFAAENVLVGAGGFQLSLSNSSALVNSRGKERREVDYTDQGMRAEVCEKADGTVKGNGPTASVCGYFQMGKRVEKSKFESETQSDTTQYSSNFEAGLRLPNTPLPNYPAGALIGVVESPDGEGFKPEKFLVVDKQSIVILKKGQKLRFVVNDCYSKDSSGSLAVEVSPRISTAAASIAMLNDFASILSSNEIIERKSKIVISGSAIEAEIQNLRSHIVKTFVAKHDGNTDYRKIPQVQAIFDAWLDQDMLEVRKRFDIRMQERKVRDLDLEYRAFNTRMNAEARSEKIQSEIFELSLTNLDQNLLADRLLRILNFTDSSIMPLIDLYYPGLRIETEFKQLNSLPLDASLKVVGDSLEDAFAKINDEVLIKALYRNIGGSQFQNLLVRIPRPEISAEGSEWPVASNPVRQKVWEYLLSDTADKLFSLSIPVEALYQQNRVKGRLSCNQILPVIDSSMIGFKVTREIGAQPILMNDLNAGPTVATLTVGPRVQYATALGPIDYRIVNGTLNNSQISQIPVNYASSFSTLLEQLSKLTTDGVAARAAYGYSPFGDFNFDGLNLIRDFTKAKLDGLDGVEEIVLIFRAKVDSTQDRPSWIGECASGT
jgi:hypothetical protein